MARQRSGRKTEGATTFIELLDQDQPFKNFQHEKHDPIQEKPDDFLQKIQGSLIGLAVGDALGAPVEFRPYQYVKENPVTDMLSGGTWGLQKGQWTDDTSMALCLAASLIVKRGFDPYDQFQRYSRWFREGYLSSTGKCFDIGKSTREAIMEFEKRKQEIEKKLEKEKVDKNPPNYEDQIKTEFNNRSSGLKLGLKSAAGNGALMRLAALPCFFNDSYDELQIHIDEATRLTHGDPKAVDACKFYAGLIFYALKGMRKEQLLQKKFYKDTLKLSLDGEIKEIAEGSYKKKTRGYDDGIRGKGYIANSLEAALWAFFNDEDKFENGVLKAISLGDDTDTTAAIYGELAGAVYGISNIRPQWVEQLFQHQFIIAVANNLYAIRNLLKAEQLQRSVWDQKSTKDYGDGTYQGRYSEIAATTNETNFKKSTNDGDPNNNQNANTKGSASAASSADKRKTSGRTDPTGSKTSNAADNSASKDSPNRDGRFSGNKQKHDNNASPNKEKVDDQPRSNNDQKPHTLTEF